VPHGSRVPRHRTLDAVLVAWIIAWAAVGYWVGQEVDDLAGVTTSVRTVGGGVVDAGDAIGGLRDLPLVGGAVAKPGEAIARAGRDAQAAADDARAAGSRLAVLLGLSVALIPVLPVLAVYLPPRLALERERRALTGGVPDELLARRALVHLPLHELARVSPDPLGDLEAGRFADLAAAERRRLDVPR
jgi:hypothetical protein